MGCSFAPAPPINNARLNDLLRQMQDQALSSPLYESSDSLMTRGVFDRRLDFALLLEVFGLEVAERLIGRNVFERDSR